MWFNRWHLVAATIGKPKFYRIGLMSGIGLVIAVLLQHPASAQSQPAIESGRLLSPEFLSFSCVAVGLFIGSLLVIESRRWLTFGLGLLGIVATGGAIALIAYSYDQLLPYVHSLWISLALGFGLGIVPVGLWWWGQRQGYGKAVAITLFQRKRKDPILKQLLKQHAPSRQSNPVGFWKTLTYRAAAVRYRRMMNRDEIRSLYALIQRQVQADGRKERAARLAAQRKQKQSEIKTLLSEADALCERPDPTGTIPAIQPLANRP
ncbi:MAG: hypothetical protein AAFN40_03390 [Cyanobacteria bacterium J06560_6]